MKPLRNPYETLTHRIHVWYICKHLGYIDGKIWDPCYHIYIAYMDPMGYEPPWNPPFKPPFEGHRLVGDLRTCGRQPAVIGLLPQRAVAPGHAAVAGLRTALAQRGAPKEPGPVIFSGPNLWMFEVVIFFVDPISECLMLWFLVDPISECLRLWFLVDPISECLMLWFLVDPISECLRLWFLVDPISECLRLRFFVDPISECLRLWFLVDPISECLRLWFFLWTQSLNVWCCDFLWTQSLNVWGCDF